MDRVAQAPAAAILVQREAAGRTGRPRSTSTGLFKRFGDLEVLKGVSLTAHEHDVIAILGASGSGKSTLLRCINLLEVPDSGEVHVGGELIRMKDRPARPG